MDGTVGIENIHSEYIDDRAWNESYSNVFQL